MEGLLKRLRLPQRPHAERGSPPALGTLWASAVKQVSRLTHLRWSTDDMGTGPTPKLICWEYNFAIYEWVC